jgi:hypothetical protein
MYRNTEGYREGKKREADLFKADLCQLPAKMILMDQAFCMLLHVVNSYLKILTRQN